MQLTNVFLESTDEEWNYFCDKIGFSSDVFSKWGYLESAEYFANNPHLTKKLYEELYYCVRSKDISFASYIPEKKQPRNSAIDLLERFNELPFKERQSITIQYGLMYGTFEIFEDIEAHNLKEKEEKRLIELVEKTRTDDKYIAATKVSNDFARGVLHEDDVMFYLRCEYKIQLHNLKNKSHDKYTLHIKSFLHREDKKVENCIKKIVK